MALFYSIGIIFVSFFFLRTTYALQQIRSRMMRKTFFLQSRTRLFSNLSSNIAIKDTNITPQYMEVATRLWVDRFVFGKGLCPWSGSVLIGNKMKICTLYGDGKDKGILEFTDSIINEIGLLYDNDSEDDPSTTLIIIPDFKIFDDFLDVIDIINGLLEVDGIDEYIQVAHFHPDYVFADSIDPENDVENYTNRSPFPVLHFLQVSEVSKAIDGYNDGDTSTVWKKNKETMKSLGLLKIKEITSKLLLDARRIVDENKRCKSYDVEVDPQNRLYH